MPKNTGMGHRIGAKKKVESFFLDFIKKTHIPMPVRTETSYWCSCGKRLRKVGEHWKHVGEF